MTNAARLGSALLLAAIAGCSEKPQLLIPEGDARIERLQRDGELRERTLNQGESARMSY